MMGARHTIAPAKGEPDTGGKSRVVMREGTRPYQTWFDTQDYETLGCIKHSFILNMPDIDLSPAFEDFRPWLEKLHSDFSGGFGDKLRSRRRKLGRKQAGVSADRATPTRAPFDDETLGGYVNYSTIVEPT